MPNEANCSFSNYNDFDESGIRDLQELIAKVRSRPRRNGKLFRCASTNDAGNFFDVKVIQTKEKTKSPETVIDKSSSNIEKNTPAIISLRSNSLNDINVLKNNQPNQVNTIVPSELIENVVNRRLTHLKYSIVAQRASELNGTTGNLTKIFVPENTQATSTPFTIPIQPVVQQPGQLDLNSRTPTKSNELPQTISININVNTPTKEDAPGQRNAAAAAPAPFRVPETPIAVPTISSNINQITPQSHHLPLIPLPCENNPNLLNKNKICMAKKRINFIGTKSPMQKKVTTTTTPTKNNQEKFLQSTQYPLLKQTAMEIITEDDSTDNDQYLNTYNSSNRIFDISPTESMRQYATIITEKKQQAATVGDKLNVIRRKYIKKKPEVIEFIKNYHKLDGALNKNKTDVGLSKRKLYLPSNEYDNSYVVEENRIHRINEIMEATSVEKNNTTKKPRFIQINATESYGNDMQITGNDCDNEIDVDNDAYMDSQQISSESNSTQYDAEDMSLSSIVVRSTIGNKLKSQSNQSQSVCCNQITENDFEENTDSYLSAYSMNIDSSNTNEGFLDSSSQYHTYLKPPEQIFKEKDGKTKEKNDKLPDLMCPNIEMKKFKSNNSVALKQRNVKKSAKRKTVTFKGSNPNILGPVVKYSMQSTKLQPTTSTITRVPKSPPLLTLKIVSCNVRIQRCNELETMLRRLDKHSLKQNQEEEENQIMINRKKRKPAEIIVPSRPKRIRRPPIEYWTNTGEPRRPLQIYFYQLTLKKAKKKKTNQN